MDHLNLQGLADRLKEHRVSKGVREAAKEIGISPATLSRVENGKVPDLETFGKICEWLGDDPSTYLGLSHNAAASKSAQVHFKKGDAIALDTAEALGRMILLAHQALQKEDEFQDEISGV